MRGRGGGLEAKGQPEPRTKHSSFFLILFLVEKILPTSVQSHITLGSPFLTGRNTTPDICRGTLLSHKPEQGAHFQRGQPLLCPELRT